MFIRHVAARSEVKLNNTLELLAKLAGDSTNLKSYKKEKTNC